jgi:hypothetical protein
MPYIFTSPTNNHKENQLVMNLEDLTLELNDLIGQVKFNKFLD